MKATSYQPSAFSKNVGTRNETRENKMFVNKEEMKSAVGAQFHCAKSSHSLAALLLPLALFLAPQAVQAQCTPTPTGTPLAPAPASGTVTCDPGDYADGINYTSLGDLTLEVPDDAVDLRVLDEGVTVTGNGADNIFWDSSAFVSGDIVGDADTGTFDSAVLDYLSDTGNVDILVGGDIKGQDDASHAIRAESIGGGNVSVTTQGQVNIRAGFSDPNPSGIGIEALTTTGDIAISASQRVDSGRANGLYAIHADSSAGGDIDIDIVTGGSFAALAWQGTHGILAETTGAGNIAIDADGGIQASSSSGAVGDKIGIEASTDTGNIAINAVNVQGVERGLLAETGGAGTITLDIGRAQSSGGGTSIQAIADTGDIIIGSGGVSYSGSFATGIETQTDGLATINVTGIVGPSSSGSSAGEDSYAIRSSGNAAVVTLEGAVPADFFDAAGLRGAVDFSGLTSGADFNIRAGNIWALGIDKIANNVTNTPISFFSDGDDTVNIDAGGFLSMPFFASGGSFSSPTVAEDIVTVRFGDGTDTVTNAGHLLVGPIGASNPFRQNSYEAELRLEDLTAFDNAGTIWLGADIQGGIGGGGFQEATDLWPDDILAMPGATYRGEPGSRLMIDANLNAQQSSCDASQRDADGDLAADCLAIQGGATEGVTKVSITEMLPFDRGGAVEIVIVDVAGGSSGAGHFVLDEETFKYIPVFGGAIDKGIFIYPIVYDADRQQHILAGVPGQDMLQLPRMAQASHDLWRLSTATSLDRQADLRNRGDEDGGLWLRFANESTDGDVTDVGRAGSQTWDFDNSFSRDAYAVTFGLDLLAGDSGDSAWIFGAMGGYINADVKYDVSPNRAEINGWSLGAYAGYVAGPLWIDGAVNVNEATLRQHIPSLDLTPPDTKVSNDLRSVGARVDAGWRIDLTDLFFVEPLASVSYVTTSFDTLDIIPDDANRPGLELDWDDPASLRAGLGGRIGSDYDLSFMRGQVSLTAKVWNESDGESVVSIHNNAFEDDDELVKDSFDDTVTEVTVGATVRSPGDAVSGFINLGGATSSDYDSFSAKLGVRYQW